MPGAFEIIEILKVQLPAHKIPAIVIEKLAGLSSGKLSLLLNGNAVCGGADSQRLIKVWEGIKKLIVAAKPLPLSFRDAAKIQHCLDLLENGSLQVIVYEQQL